MPRPRDAILTDPEVVAAFNSCLDLEKWNALSYNVKTRFKELLCHNRVKAVCFMDNVGLGLRVYDDQNRLSLTYEDEGDEAELGTTPVLETDGKVNIHGFWLRCPAKMYLEKVKPAAEEYLVMNEQGLKFVRAIDEDENCVNSWTSQNNIVSRNNAHKFSKEMADRVAGWCRGIVVKA